LGFDLRGIAWLTEEKAAFDEAVVRRRALIEAKG
jgi:hypothetical protein